VEHGLEVIDEGTITAAHPAPLLFVDQLFLSRPRPERVTTPMLVLGAESDGSITQAEVRATAQAYRTDAEFFPGMGHDMMLERGWESVADRIHTWLGTRGL
jgi:alpha-beta hydrolase superfamily lysophospholipase